MSKLWNEPWDHQDLVDNAPNWSLAGDAGLLRFLEQFSSDVINRIGETNNNLENLSNDLNDTSLSLDMVNNDLLSLQSTQFIESRVYEEDETLSPEKEDDNIDKPLNETQKLNITKEAIFKGIKVVEKYFDKIEVPQSDSEDDTDFPSFVLQPRDPYLDRPLPYVIGTQEWHDKWHVGLLESSSESENDISGTNSENESEPDESQLNNNLNYSNSGSESSTIREITKSDNEINSIPAQVSANNFAAVLAAKLGNVVQVAEENEPEINRKPIGKTEKRSSIFFDEPPPLDDENDDLFGSLEKPGLFSGTKGLFDDLDDSGDFWGGNKQQTSKTNEQNSKIKQTIVPKNSLPNLFDDNSESDDDLFSTKTNDKNKISYLNEPIKSVQPLIDEEPPNLSEPTKKKPIGGVSVTGGANLFGDKKFGDILRRRRNSSDSDETTESFAPAKVPETIEERKQPPKEQTPVPVVKPEPVKKASLFDDADDLFADDLFNTKNLNTNLFQEDLFNQKPPTDDLEVTLGLSKENSDADVSLFSRTPPPEPEIDWDDPTDNLDDESLFDAPIFGGRSNLFDAEPPELFPEKNIQESVVPPFDTNRKLSSDIFAESDDSLFISKKSESYHRTDTATSSGLFEKPSTLTSQVLENPLEVQKDLFPDDKGPEIDEDELFGGNSRDSPPELSNVEKKDELGVKISKIDELFEGNSQESAPELSKTKKEDELAGKISKIGALFEENSRDLPPESSNANKEDEFGNLSKVDALFGKNSRDSPPELSNVKKEDELADKKSKIGKLKQNLNIDVNALRPGIGLPRKKTETEETPDKSLTRSQSDDVIDRSQSNTAINLDDNTEILHSVTKDRARIQVRRRPSTRKGRHEMLRKSIADLPIQPEEPVEKIQTIEHIPVEEKENDDIFAPSTNYTFDDIFVDDVTTTKATWDDLFDDTKKSDDLFQEAVVRTRTPPLEGVATVKSIRTTKGIFDDVDEDDDDDLFANKSLPKKKTLFDDDLDDDIFGTTLNKNPSAKSHERKPIKTSVKKVLNSQVVDDPLSAFK